MNLHNKAKGSSGKVNSKIHRLKLKALSDYQTKALLVT